VHKWRHECAELNRDIETYDKLVAALREAEVTFISRRHDVLVMESHIMKKDMMGQYPRARGSPSRLHDNHMRDDAPKADVAIQVGEYRQDIE
jgi:hypothetical protein